VPAGVAPPRVALRVQLPRPLHDSWERAGPYLKKTALTTAFVAAGPEDVDFDVTGKVPDEVNAVAETGKSTGVENGVEFGVEDLEGFRFFR